MFGFVRKNTGFHYQCLAGSTALVVAAFATPGFAATSDSEIKELKAVIERLQKKVELIEQEQAKQQSMPANRAEPVPVGNLLPSGLKIYGSLDSGVENISNVGATKETLTRVPSTTGAGPSTLGIDVRRTVADNVTAIGKAEMGIYLDAGNSGQGGRLFGRQAYVGVDSQYGSITFGRQYSMLFFSLLGGDLLGPNIYGLGSIDAYIPNARADNAIVWRGKFDNLSIGTHYSWGRDNIGTGNAPASGTCAGENTASSCRGWSAMAKYDMPSFGIATAVDRQFGGAGATAGFYNGAPPTAMTQSGDYDQRTTVNGYVKMSKLKLGAGWLGREVKLAASDIKQDTSWLQAEYSFDAKWGVDGGVFHVDNKSQNRSANMYVIRATVGASRLCDSKQKR
ncbi:MAG: porin [Betaproteobacteria bacterium]|nr:porin [Betaproteobacteria bacterium]